MADTNRRKASKKKVKKKKRFLMGFDNSWLIDEKLLPYSNLVEGYSFQLLENPFQIKSVPNPFQVKQEPQDGLLVDQQESSSYLDEVIII